jgi:alpha-aminoadipate carrier protein LysW
MSTIHCVECDGAIELSADLVAGEIVECPECGVELEVVETDPLSVQLAPEVEEDWGE